MTTVDQDRGSILVVGNQSAGSVDDQLMQDVLSVLRRDRDVEYVVTSTRADLRQTLTELSRRRLIVMGGDGSLHAAISAMHALEILGSTTVGLIPLGTGNDLARTVGLPLDPMAAADVAVGNNTRQLDFMKSSDGGIVVNAAHVGVGAEAARAGQSVKGILGAAGYAAGAIAAGVKTSGWELTIELDDNVVVEPPESVLMTAVSVGSSIGGGTPVAPDAIVDDGWIEVMISGATGPIARAGFGLDMRKGEHAGRDDVVVARARKVRVTGDGFPVNTDGELEDAVADRSWSLVPKAWRLAVP